MVILRRVVALLLAAGALAACTSSGGSDHPTVRPSTSSRGGAGSDPDRGPSTGSGTPTPAPAPAPAPTVTSTATPWSTAVAAKHYTAITTPVNQALLALQNAPEDATLPQARAVLQGLTSALSSLVAGLVSGAWPVAARADVNAYIAASLTERDIFTALAAKSSTTEMRRHVDSVQDALSAAASASAAVAHDLGVAAG